MNRLRRTAQRAPVGYGLVAKAHARVRALTAAFVAVGAFTVGVGGRSTGAYLVAALALPVGVDAVRRTRKPAGSPESGLLLDAALVLGTVIAIRPPAVVVAPAVFALLVSSIILLPAIRAVFYVAGFAASAAILSVLIPVGPRWNAAGAILVAGSVAVPFVVLVTVLLGFAVLAVDERTQLDVQLEEAAEQVSLLVVTHERHLRYERAVANASRVLLSDNDDALGNATRSLLDATQADAVFVARNFEDARFGLCAGVMHVEWRADAPGRAKTPPTICWSNRPAAFASLSGGCHYTFNTDDLAGRDRYLAVADGIRSQLTIPVFVQGEWAGVIGFMDLREARDWPPEDVELLTTAAGIVGAFWGRLDARSRLQRLVESKDQFVASVSHELRTPLTGVVGLAHELRDGLDDFSDPEIREFIALIAEQSTDMSYLVDNLLVAARAEIGTITVRPAPLDLVAEAEKAADSLRIEISTRVEGSYVQAWADPARTRQVIRNLITNADRYGGAHIEVIASTHSRSAILEVRDDGPGIAEDDRERVFELFERSHARNGQPDSMGLGLAVARQLTRLMGGELAYRTSGGWSVFVLTLPIADSAISEPTKNRTATE